MVFYLELPLAWSDGSLIRQIGVLDPPFYLQLLQRAPQCSLPLPTLPRPISCSMSIFGFGAGFHVVHEQDRIRLLVRLPMSYLVADKLGPDTAGGTRAPPPIRRTESKTARWFTTSRNGSCAVRHLPGAESDDTEHAGVAGHRLYYRAQCHPCPRILRLCAEENWAVVLPCVLVATIWTGERGSQFFSSL